MKFNVKKVEGCKLKLFVEIEAARVEARYQEVLRDFQKAATLPGFREGKAPPELVERRYAKEAEEELIKSLVPEAYHQCVAQHKLSPVSLPEISEIRFERGKNFSFSAQVEKAPEFSLKNYKGIKIKKVPIDVDTEDVRKGLEALAESRAELVPLVESRAIERGDFVVTDIEMWQEGRYVPGKKGVLLYVEPQESDDFFEKVIGARPDEVREISAEPTPEEKGRGLVGRKPSYKVWVREVRQKKVPALDDAFAKSVGKETLEELREAVRRELAGHKNTRSQNLMKNELLEKLAKLASFELPGGLLAKQKERLAAQASRQGVPAGPAELEQKAREQLKLYFILQKVADEQNIEVDETELERRLGALAEEAKRPIEEIRRVFEEDIRESMKEARTIDFLLANAKLEDSV